MSMFCADKALVFCSPQAGTLPTGWSENSPVRKRESVCEALSTSESEVIGEWALPVSGQVKRAQKYPDV